MNWRVVFFGVDGSMISAVLFFGSPSKAMGVMGIHPEGCYRVELQKEVDICCGNKEWVTTYERIV